MPSRSSNLRTEVASAQFVATVRADLFNSCSLWEAETCLAAVTIALRRLLLVPQVRAVLLFRLSQCAYHTRGLRFLGYVLRSRIMRLCAADLHPAARIAPGFMLVHGVGVVVGQDVVAGRDLALFQNVTLGDKGAPGQPTIGNRVTIGAGAKVLGPISIGDGAIIGANSVVLSDVPAYVTVVGAPARVVAQRNEPAPDAPGL